MTRNKNGGLEREEGRRDSEKGIRAWIDHENLKVSAARMRERQSSSRTEWGEAIGSRWLGTRRALAGGKQPTSNDAKDFKGKHHDGRLDERCSRLLGQLAF